MIVLVYVDVHAQDLVESQRNLSLKDQRGNPLPKYQVGT